MRKILAVAATTALLSTLAGPPASAQGVVTFICNLFYDNPGPSTQGYGYCTATGEVNGRILTGQQVELNFSASNSCPFQSVNGTMTGAVHLNFAWSRIGTAGVITTSGETMGASYMIFASECPRWGEQVIFAGGGA